MAEDADDVVADAIAPADVPAAPPVDDAPPPAPSEVDALAAEMGWAPKDQWRGNPDDWKDAKTFLKRTVEINRTLSSDVRELKQTTQKMARTSAAIMERALLDQKEELEARFDAAVAANDPKAARQAQADLAKLSEPASGEPEGIKDFESRNPWFGNDKEATAFAVSVCEVNKHLSHDEQLKLAEDAVRKRFPEHFPEGKKPQPVVNDPGTRISATPRGKTFADMPREAQAACAAFEKKGVKRADYVKSFFEENA